MEHRQGVFNAWDKQLDLDLASSVLAVTTSGASAPSFTTVLQRRPDGLYS